MATWPRWGAPCEAHLTDGSRQCRAYAVTGCRTCRAHGSGTRAAIEAGKVRAEIARVWLVAGRELARRLAALDERRQRDPDGLWGDTREWLEREVDSTRSSRSRGT